MKKIQKILLLLFTCSLVVLMCSAKFNSKENLALNKVTIFKTLDQLPNRKNNAFKEGEILTYRLHYGPINAGVAILEVKPTILEVNGRSVYHIVANGYSTGSTDVFFKVRDRYETYMDKDALLPWLFVRRVNEGGYKFSQDYTFNHYTKKVDIGNNQNLDVPTGIQDMVSAFYSARNLDLSNAKDGDVFSFNCFLDKEVWPLRIRFVSREDIDTDIGKVHALRFQPIVQKGRIFKHDEDLNVWISDDKNHIVLRAKANVLVGSIKMDISSTKNLSNALNMAN